MEKGQIVRRRALNKKCCQGPYGRIIKMERNRVLVEVLDGLNLPPIYIDKNFINVPTQKSIIISNNMYNKLNEKHQMIVSHSVSITWDKLYCNEPEIIRFKSLMQYGELIFEVERYERIWQLNEYVIKIHLKHRIA